MRAWKLVLTIALFALTAEAQLAPILECVKYDATANTITAEWGYANTGPDPKTINPGPGNFFTPAPSFQGQPIVFQPSAHHFVFETTFDLNVTGSSSWHLQGITETASNDPNHYCPSANSACWDANANGICDPAEDINGDGVCDARDCQGRIGATGATGSQGPRGGTGPQGPAGPSGISPAIRVATNASASATASVSCNATEVLLNGGGTCAVPNSNSISGRLASSAPSGANSWTVSCSTGQATAVALCALKQ
jgi:hypothetical protein